MGRFEVYDFLEKAHLGGRSRCVLSAIVDDIVIVLLVSESERPAMACQPTPELASYESCHGCRDPPADIIVNCFLWMRFGQIIAVMSMGVWIYSMHVHTYIYLSAKCSLYTVISSTCL